MVDFTRIMYGKEGSKVGIMQWGGYRQEGRDWSARYGWYGQDWFCEFG
jgi:hypothetical protein